MRKARVVALLALAVVACGGGAAGTFIGDGPDAATPDAGGDVVTPPTDGPVEGDTPDAAVDGADAGADADAALDADAAPDPVLLRFAVIGDYGNNSARELLVANLVTSWSPDLVVTTGDNNYGSTSASYDPNVGQYYQSFLYPYAGAYGPGAAQQMFFPSIGNHDWDIDNGTGYAAFFNTPGFYYELDRGPVHFVFIDSDVREPDGVSPVSTQGVWAQTSLANTAQPYSVVIFHHPALTSGNDKSNWMDWPFKGWGADVVLTGHVHNFERLRTAGGLTHFVVGQSGTGTSSFGTPHPASEKRYNTADGAQLVEVTAKAMRFRYYTVGGALIDDISLDPAGNPVP